MGAYSIAYADGTCDAKEIATLEKPFRRCQPSRRSPVRSHK